ncbi:cold-shock protein [Streptomyces sp. S6]|nr:cold-shock protein [Streptomyces sp. S6]
MPGTYLYSSAQNFTQCAMRLFPCCFVPASRVIFRSSFDVTQGQKGPQAENIVPA